MVSSELILRMVASKSGTMLEVWVPVDLVARSCFFFLVTWTTMKMMTSTATAQRVSTSIKMCTSILLSTVESAVGTGESGMSEGFCLHMRT